MTIEIFTDNDVIFKLARYELLTQCVDMFNSHNYMFRYLDALPYIAGINQPSRANKMGFESTHVQSIKYFVDKSMPVIISDEQALEVIAQLRTPHLDAGELILTFGAQENKPAGLFTGDKRAINVINRMQKNALFALDDCQVLLLEEAIRIIMRCGDREQIITHIQSRPHVDKSLDICFRNLASVDDALQSYIQNVVTKCTSLAFVQLEENT